MARVPVQREVLVVREQRLELLAQTLVPTAGRTDEPVPLRPPQAGGLEQDLLEPDVTQPPVFAQ